MILKSKRRCSTMFYASILSHLIFPAVNEFLYCPSLISAGIFSMRPLYLDQSSCTAGRLFLPSPSMFLYNLVSARAA